ncbi:MAG TPA: NFACT family protein [Petrotogaceae bacterium]|nr:NFACT family protein [Petrotogaceae bacterium]HQP59252.1 NFACT family protein [Petrotogaceae bacterium]
MPIDGLAIYKLINEARERVLNKSIKNIYQPVEDQLLIQTSGDFLLFSVQNPSYLLVLEKKPDIPENPYNFSMFLRKRIKGGKILSVEQLGTDRIGYMEIQGYDEIGDLRKYRLYFELMGRNSNIILVNEDNIIQDAMKRGTAETRLLVHGIKYIPFFDDSKVNIMSGSKTSEEDVLDIKASVNLQGFCKTSLGALVFYNTLQELRQEIASPYLYVYTDEKGNRDISALKPNGSDIKKLTPSAAIIDVFEFKANQSRFLAMRKELLKKLEREVDKDEKIKDNLQKDISEQSKIPELSKKAELLQSFVYKVSKGDESILTQDWVTGEDILIKLDPIKTPSQNLQDYFRKLKKIKNRVGYALEKIVHIEKELEYYYQLMAMLDEAEDIQTLEEIKVEMIQQGLVDAKNKTIKKSEKNNPYRKFNYNGFDILVGKNNVQNDEITKNARADDIWLHTRGIPGSHVIIKCAGKEVPYDVILYAATVAAKYSRAKFSSNVGVDYTKKSNVYKPKGSKPGMVLYESYSTVFVTPVF